MNKIFNILILLASSFAILAQDRQDVIYLKNGDIIKGVIIENVLNDYVKVELLGGSILTYKYDQITKFAKDKKDEKIQATPNTVIMQQQQVSQQPAPLQQNNTPFSMTDMQKAAMYERDKKEEWTAIVLSLLLTSAGHAYAGNWGRGLLFLLGKIGAIGMMATEDGPRYSDDRSLVRGLGVGFLLAFIIGEPIDAAREVRNYNERLYTNIYGLPPVTFDNHGRKGFSRGIVFNYTIPLNW